jgi:acyl-CoA thioester hydrolase
MHDRDLPEPPQAFELTIEVQESDIDQLGHVNNVTYLRWVQDIAVAHWNAAAPEDEKSRLLWVVLRHEIDYKHPGFAGDVLIIRTWVGDARRLRFDRHTEFLRPRDGRYLAKARTVWCPIDAATGRPVEVSSRVRASFSNPGENRPDTDH